MTNQHPITPPLELVGQWSATVYRMTAEDDERDLYIATQAAQWGADQELDACCEQLKILTHTVEQLRIIRRPKPPSLKEQALQALRHAPGPDYPNPITLLTADEHALIRRALEALPE